MSSSKFLLSAFSALLLTGSASFGINKIIKNSKSKKTKQKQNTQENYFFIGTISDIKEQITNEILKDNQCIINSEKNTILKTCKIFKTKDMNNKDNNWKISDLFKNSENLLNKLEDIKNNSQVIIQFNKEEFEKLNENDSISITDKNKKTYFRINLNKKFNYENNFKTDLILANIVDNSFDPWTFVNSLELKIIDSNEFFECSIFSIDNTIERNAESIPFIASDFNSVKSIDTNQKIIRNKLILIKINKKISEDYFLNKKLEIFIKNNDEDESIKRKISIEYKKPIINNLFSQLENLNNFEYIIVNSEPSVKNADLSSSLSNLNNKNTKNYKCKFETNNETIEDETCEIFKLNLQSSDYEIIDLNALKTKKSLIKKMPSTSSNKYILKINSSLYAKIKTNNKKIKIMSNIEPSKEFLTFNEEIKLNIIDGKFRTNMIFGIIKEAHRQTHKTIFKCKFNQHDTEFQNCKIYVLTNANDSSTKINIQNFKKINETNAQKNKSIIIIFEDENKKNFKNQKQLMNYSPVIYASNSEDISNQNKYLEIQLPILIFGEINQEFAKSKIISTTLEMPGFFIGYKNQETEENVRQQSNQNNQDYICRIINKNKELIEDSCFVASLQNVDNKLIDADTFMNPRNQANPQDFLKNKFFTINMSNPELIDKIFFEDSEIQVIPKQGSKILATIKPGFKVQNNMSIGKTNWLIAKSKSSSNNQENFKNLKCKLDGESYSSECSVYKFATNISDSNQLKDIDLSKANVKITSSSDIEENKYVLIKFNNVSDSKNIETLPQELTLKTSNNEIINNYEIIAPIYSESNENLTNQNSIIALI